MGFNYKQIQNRALTEYKRLTISKLGNLKYSYQYMSEIETNSGAGWIGAVLLKPAVTVELAPVVLQVLAVAGTYFLSLRYPFHPPSNISIFAKFLCFKSDPYMLESSHVINTLRQYGLT